jgi:hypothetical protein
MMKKRAWLIAAVLLLGLAAFLMARGDKPRTAQRAKVEFPRHAKPEERQRAERRRTLAPQGPSEDPEAPSMRRDPLLVALPDDPKTSAVVFEVADLKNSPVGQAWLDCMLEREGKGKGRGEFKEKFGIDPFNDVERVAISSGKVAILSVESGAAKFDRSGWSKRTFGGKGVIYEDPQGNGVMATWGDEIVVAGADAKGIEEAIGRLESKSPKSSVIPEWSAYGDIYGVLSPEDLAGMLPEDQREMAERLKTAIERVDLHVDASEDVAIVADVNGPQKDEMQDLAKSLGATLSLARATAAERGDDKLAELLDDAKVSPRDGRFSVDMALPLAVMKEWGPCRKRASDGGP